MTTIKGINIPFTLLSGVDIGRPHALRARILGFDSPALHVMKGFSKEKTMPTAQRSGVFWISVHNSHKITCGVCDMMMTNIFQNLNLLKTQTHKLFGVDTKRLDACCYISSIMKHNLTMSVGSS